MAQVPFAHPMHVGWVAGELARSRVFVAVQRRRNSRQLLAAQATLFSPIADLCRVDGEGRRGGKKKEKEGCWLAVPKPVYRSWPLELIAHVYKRWPGCVPYLTMAQEASTARSCKDRRRTAGPGTADAAKPNFSGSFWNCSYDFLLRSTMTTRRSIWTRFFICFNWKVSSVI